MLQRMRELAVQAASDTIDNTDRGYINTELQALKNEINAVATRTVFNGQSLLTGSLQTTLAGATATDLVVGDTLTSATSTSVAAIDVSGAQAGATYTFTSTAAGTLTLTNSLNTAAQTINVVGMAANGSQVLNFSNLGVKVTLQANSGGAADTAAALVAGLTAAANDTIVTAGAGGSANIQVGANSSDVMGISFSDTQISATTNAALNTALATFGAVPGTSTTSANANALLTAIDSALTYSSGLRSTLGANMNRLGHTVANLEATGTNLSAAASRITDADFASETAALTRANILQQAGTAMLAQANSQPNGVMALLQRL